MEFSRSDWFAIWTALLAVAISVAITVFDMSPFIKRFVRRFCIFLGIVSFLMITFLAFFDLPTVVVSPAVVPFTQLGQTFSFSIINNMSVDVYSVEVLLTVADSGDYSPEDFSFYVPLSERRALAEFQSEELAQNAVADIVQYDCRDNRTRAVLWAVVARMKPHESRDFTLQLIGGTTVPAKPASNIATSPQIMDAPSTSVTATISSYTTTPLPEVISGQPGVKGQNGNVLSRKYPRPNTLGHCGRVQEFPYVTWARTKDH